MWGRTFNLFFTLSRPIATRGAPVYVIRYFGGSVEWIGDLLRKCWHNGKNVERVRCIMKNEEFLFFFKSAVGINAHNWPICSPCQPYLMSYCVTSTAVINLTKINGIGKRLNFLPNKLVTPRSLFGHLTLKFEKMWTNEKLFINTIKIKDKMNGLCMWDCLIT